FVRSLLFVPAPQTIPNQCIAEADSDEWDWTAICVTCRACPLPSRDCPSQVPRPANLLRWTGPPRSGRGWIRIASRRVIVKCLKYARLVIVLGAAMMLAGLAPDSWLESCGCDFWNLPKLRAELAV